MNKALKVFSYIFGVLIIGALLSYPAYLLAQEIPFLAHYRFGRVSNRVFMILAIVGLIPFFKKLKNINFKKSGLIWDKKLWARHFTLGYIYGLSTMLLMGLLLSYTGVRPWREVIEVNVMIGALLKGFLAGFIISLIEEPLFRGVLFQSLSKQYSRVFAIISISAVFACVHFFKSKSGTITDVHWYSGFIHLKNAFYLWESPRIIGAVLTLFAVSVFMHLTVLKNGNLIAAIGIHTGWVNAIKVIKKFSINNDNTWMLSNYDRVTGYVAFAWITVLIIIYVLINKKKIFAKDETCED